MNERSFVPSYIIWHYSKAFFNIYGIFSNFYWTLWKFFSVGTLLKTFFSPWKRLDEVSTKKGDLGDFFGNLIVNLLMRIVGMIIRIIFIAIGFISIILLFLVEIISFISWFLMPVIICYLLFKGFVGITK